MKKELCIKIYNRMKELNLNVSVMSKLLKFDDSTIYELLDKNDQDFIKSINLLIKESNLNENFSDLNPQAEINKIINHLYYSANKNVTFEYIHSLINYGFKTEEINIILQYLKEIKNKNIAKYALKLIEINKIRKSNKFIEFIEIFSKITSEDLSLAMFMFIRETHINPKEILKLINLILNNYFYSKEVIFSILKIVDNYKLAKQIIEILIPVKSASIEMEVKKLISFKPDNLDDKKLLEYIKIIANTKYIRQAEVACAVLTNLNQSEELAKLLANTKNENIASYGYEVIMKNSKKDMTELIKYVKLITSCESKIQAKEISEVLKDEVSLNSGKALVYAKKISKLTEEYQWRYASSVATNELFVVYDIVEEIIESFSNILGEDQMKKFNKCLWNEDLLNSGKIVQFAHILSKGGINHMCFVNENMLNKDMINKEEFLDLVDLITKIYVTHQRETLEKLIINNNISFDLKKKMVVILENINYNVAIDCLICVVENSNIIGYEKASETLDKLIELCVSENKIGISTLHLEIIKEIENKVLRKKSFIEMYKQCPQLAMDLLIDSDIPDNEEITENLKIRKKNN